MNDHECSYYDDERDFIAMGRQDERKALAATLTRLRKSSKVIAYQDALDDVAKAHGLRTETTVRYVA